MSKDWNRASFEANTRPIKVERDITSADLVVPSNGGLLVLTLGCIACGLGLALLFVFWPLMLVALLDVGVGRWIVPAVLASGVVFAAWLLIWELRVRRDVADELLGN
jgi:uncharacterized membrane protein YdbT with pleckstrin-like domain